MSLKIPLPFLSTICALTSCMSTAPMLETAAPSTSVESAPSSSVESLPSSSGEIPSSMSVKGPSSTSVEGSTSAESPSPTSVESPTPRASLAPAAAPIAPADHQYEYPTAGSWEFTLGGSGSADKHFDNGGFALSGALGFYLTDALEISARQNAQLSDFGNSQFQGQTRVALDFNLGNGPVRPVLGANLGYVYGDQVRDTWSAAPEAGLKIYLQRNVFLSLMGEYQFFFEHSNQVDEAFDTGAFLFEVGLGLNF